MAVAAGGSTILKRVAFLNRSGILTKPLRYSEVKGSLEALSTEDALKLLNDLEEQAASTPDPVAFIKDGALAPPGGKKRKATSLDEDEASALANGGGIIAKRIKHLNSAGRLTRPIMYSRVREALESLDVGQAMVILTGLEDVAGKVRDPTGYIRAAVRAAGGRVPADATAQPEEEAELTAEPVEAPEEDEMQDVAQDGDEESVPAAPATPPRKPVKSEMFSKNIKSELGKGKGKGKYGGWVKAEDLSDEEKIGRRINWLNENLGFPAPIEISEVMVALDSIGLRQSMRVLRRLEEGAADVPDPNDFIKDLVARSGWIWAKPDVIDDDEKVAKRVSWLNQFGGLLAPIDYVDVADILDGLKVPHAMVLLRELELQAHTIEDPTEYIRKTVALAGEDDVQVPEVEAGGEDTAIGQRIAWLNANASLVAPIEFGEVMSGLNRIGDAQAMALLQEVEDKGPSVKDPTGFIKFKLKAKLASMGFTLEETRDTETEILKRIEWLNDYGGLSQDIDYNTVAAPLEAIGIEQAMTVLKELEDKRQTVRDPTAFIRQSISLASKKAAPPAAVPRPPASKPAGRNQAGTAGSAADFKTLSGFVGVLSKKSRKPIKFSDIAAALDTLGPRATVVLKEMQEKGLGLDDPVQYINAAAFRAERDQAKYQRGGEEDDVQKLTRKLNWLNQFGGLAETIKLEEVVGALYCLGIPQSMAILKGLQEKGSKVKDPTWYIKAAVQRANGVTAKLGVKAELGVKGEEEDEDEEEFDAAMEEDAEDEEAAEADEYPEVEGDGLNEGEAEDEEYLAGVTAEMEAANAEAREELEEMGDEAWIEAIPAAKVPMLRKGSAKPKAPSQPQVRAMMQEKDHRTSYFPTTAPKEAEEEEQPKPSNVKRVVGTVTGFNKLIPHEAKKERKLPPKPMDYAEEAPRASVPAGTAALPITPQEKMAQVRNLAMKVGLSFDDNALKALARLPFYRAKDLIDEVLLGGKNRRGVNNPSRYVCLGVQRMSLGLGVEQGIAMELAVSVGVVLNNEALDELASIPRKDSHALIREISKSEEAKADPIGFIRMEVRRLREAADARPFPFASMG